MKRKRRPGKLRVFALVQATQTVLMVLDDTPTFPKDVVLQRHIDRFYDDADNDYKVGGPRRKALADLVHELRLDDRFRKAAREAVRNSMERMLRDPQRWGLYDPGPYRLRPTTVNRKAEAAKNHPNCAYCGCGGDGVHVCCRCKAEGIAGPVIYGTEEAKAFTYQVWNRQ